MNNEKLAQFKETKEYEVAMTAIVGAMDLHMNFAREMGFTYEEAIEFTKKEIMEFMNQADIK